MVETFFTNPLFVETILPFLLVFTVMFAILEKTKILGDGKRQIDAIVSLVIAMIFVAFGQATDIVVKLIPILGVALVVILVFMVLLGSLYEPGKFKMEGWLKIVVGILIGILVAVSVLILTGGLDYVVGFVSGGGNTAILVNGFLVLVIAAAIIAVIFGGKGEGSSGGDKGK